MTDLQLVTLTAGGEVCPSCQAPMEPEDICYECRSRTDYHKIHLADHRDAGSGPVVSVEIMRVPDGEEDYDLPFAVDLAFRSGRVQTCAKFFPDVLLPLANALQEALTALRTPNTRFWRKMPLDDSASLTVMVQSNDSPTRAAVAWFSNDPGGVETKVDLTVEELAELYEAVQAVRAVILAENPCVLGSEP